MKFEIERRAYQARREQLVRDHAGEYVAFVGERLVAVTTTRLEAMNEGFDTGEIPYVVRVRERDLPVILPACCYLESS